MPYNYDMIRFDEHWQWERFRDAMSQLAQRNEKEYIDLLSFVGKADQVVGRIVSRDMGVDSDRPQDYVFAILAVRSFRLATGAVDLALRGYSDLGPNLVRTIWEIGIRLMDMQDNEPAAAYGFLLQGVHEKIEQLEADLADLKAHNQPVGFIEINLNNIKAHRDELSRIALKRGVDPEKARRRFGKTNFHDVCQRYGGAKGYKVSYGYLSSFVHEKNASTNEFLLSDRGMAQFNLGPNPDSNYAGVFDPLRYMILVLGFISDFLGDAQLALDTKSLAGELEAVRKRLEEEYMKKRTIKGT